MNEKFIPINSNISFADSSLISFNYEDKAQELSIFLKAWNEKKIRVKFNEVIFFSYKPGDIIAEIFQSISDLPIVIEALIKEYDEIPLNHSYKLYLIADINDFTICEVISNHYEIDILKDIL